jgi:hypothetical protein
LTQQEFTDYLRVFSSDEELTDLLSEITSGKQLESKNGTTFFQSKYGVVDGNEVEKIAKTRQWSEPALHPSLGVTVDNLRKQIEEAFQASKFSTPTTAADFLAVGFPVPLSVAEFDKFVFGMPCLCRLSLNSPSSQIAIGEHWTAEVPLAGKLFKKQDMTPIRKLFKNFLGRPLMLEMLWSCD